jgi:MFS family permease
LSTTSTTTRTSGATARSRAAPADGSRGRALLFAAACGGIASVSFAPAIHANFLTALSRDFGLDIRGSSLYLSLNFWGAVAAIVVAGPAARRWGSRPVLFLSWLLELVAVTAIGLAPVPLAAYAGVVVASMGFGAISVLMPHLASGLYPERRTQVMSLLVSFFTIGAVISNLMVLGLVSLGASWRVGYLAASALAIPWGILLLASPRDLFVQQQVRGAVPLRSRARATAVVPVAVLLFIAICLAQTAGAAAEVSVSMWVPTFVTGTTGGASFLGPVSLLLFCVMGAVGKLSNAALVHRVDDRVLVGVGAGLFCAGVILAAAATGPGAAMAGFGLTGLGTGGFVPAATVRLATAFPHASPSRYSLFMTIGNVGPIVGPVLIGLAAGGDLRRGLLTMVPAAVLCAVLLVVTRGRSGESARARA